MRFLILFCLFFASPIEAGAEKARKPSSLGTMPARVITFSCRENPDGPVLALGLAHLRIDFKDSTSASVGLTLYVQVKKSSFAAKSFQGAGSVVPGGYSMSMEGVDGFTLNLHPHEKTNLPGLPGRAVACEATATVVTN